MQRLFFLCWFLTGTIGASSRLEDEGRQWWKNVEYLASDDLQGREVGSKGFNLAASYVSEQFERIGLKAAGDDGYYQKVGLTETFLNTTSMTLEHGRTRHVVAMPQEAEIHFSFHSAARVESPVVFAGYGMKIPEIGYNDFEGLPIRGAVVAYLTGGPESVPGNLKSHYESPEARWKALKALGAFGMIAIPNPKKMDVPWERHMAAWGAPVIGLADARLDGLNDLPFSATWNPKMADDLLGGSGHSFAEILAAAEKDRPLPHFKTGGKLKSRLWVSVKPVASKNVVAVHPGTDPLLKNEYVVVSAHLDHLGMAAKPVHHDAIFNGAMDDASGVSSLIELAKMLKNVETKRSIVFVALTGEEKGELGSEYFTNYPTVKGKMVADLNMDMFLPLFPLKWLEVQGLEESTLGDDIRQVAEAEGVKVQPDQQPDKNRFTRSDQYSFVKAGVPAVAFKFSFQKGDPEEKISKQWYATRYHDVSDDTSQPVDLAAAARFDDLLKSLLVRLADAEHAPEWNDDSYFKHLTVPGA